MQMLCRREQISPIGWHRLHVIIYTLLVVSLFPVIPVVLCYLTDVTTVSYRDTTGNRVQSTENRVQSTENRGKRTEEREQRKETFFVFIFALSSLLFHFSLFPLTSAHHLHPCNHLNLITLRL